MISDHFELGHVHHHSPQWILHSKSYHSNWLWVQLTVFNGHETWSIDLYSKEVSNEEREEEVEWWMDREMDEERDQGEGLLEREVNQWGLAHSFSSLTLYPYLCSPQRNEINKEWFVWVSLLRRWAKKMRKKKRGKNEDGMQMGNKIHFVPVLCDSEVS